MWERFLNSARCRGWQAKQEPEAFDRASRPRADCRTIGLWQSLQARSAAS